MRLCEYDKVVLEAWVNGYVTGLQEQEGFQLTERQARDRNARAVWIDNHCEANPLDDLHDAARALYLELQSRSDDDDTTPWVCTPDTYEDNDTQATASQVSPGVFANLTACSGDDDFYSFAVADGDAVTASATLLRRRGARQLQLIHR